MRAQALVRRDKECGDDGLKDTPVPMPNTEVKLQHAKSSWGIAPCEDRTLPRDLIELWHLVRCQGSDFGELSELAEGAALEMLYTG